MAPEVSVRVAQMRRVTPRTRIESHSKSTGVDLACDLLAGRILRLPSGADRREHLGKTSMLRSR